MQDPQDTPTTAAEPASALPVRHLRLKATLLLLLSALLIGAAALYLLYARGVFEPTQSVILVTDDSEGVLVGMDMSFSGFPIGRVRRVELAATGQVHIVVDVPRKDAHWLRTSSVFTLVRGLVGGTSIRAFSGILTDPPLPDGAQRTVLRGDATAELPRVLAAARDALENINALTAQDAALATSLANLRDFTDKLKGPRGLLGATLGNDADARKLVTTLDRANDTLAQAGKLAARLDGMAGKADEQVFGPEGVMKQAGATVQQLNGLLADTRASLKRVDAVLQEAQGIGANVRGATTDLGALRADVEANLRKIESLINEINRKWPFARDTEIKLP